MDMLTLAMLELKFLQLSDATYTSYYGQFYLVLLMKNAIDSSIVSVVSRSDDEIPPPPPPPPQTPTQQVPQTMSTIKLPILKKEGPFSQKFPQMDDAKDYGGMLSKSRFGGNDESKKMQKYILKQQFEGFSDIPIKRIASKVMKVSESFDVNLRFKVSSSRVSSAQNVAFVSSESTSSTNDVSTAYGVSTSSGYNSQRENSSSYTDELMYSFFANQSSGPHLDHEDLEQLDEFDLEEMDLKWQVAMISMRLKKFYKKTGRKLHFDAKEPVGFDKTKVECYNCHKKGHFARECRSKGNTGYKSKDNGRRPRKQEEPKALVTLDGEGVDWTDHAEDEQENFALEGSL
ncbi:ribonuclease H-like domain-containing protein [Tanacetum coccineum]